MPKQPPNGGVWCSCRRSPGSRCWLTSPTAAPQSLTPDGTGSATDAGRQPIPNPPPLPMPMPMPTNPVTVLATPVTVPTTPAKLPNVIGQVSATFAQEPEQKTIAYVPLPPYLQANLNVTEIRFNLPTGMPVKGLKLHGFTEHQTQLSAADFGLQTDNSQAKKRVLDVLHACEGADGASVRLPLYTFEILDHKVAVMRWHDQKSIVPVLSFEDAVSCCVWEIQRGETPEDSLYVSMLPPVVIEPALEFDEHGQASLPTAELRLVEHLSPLTLGPTRFRVTRQEKDKSELFVFDSKEQPRRPTVSCDKMKAAFGFTSATLHAPLPLSKREEESMRLELKIAVRPLRNDEVNVRKGLLNRITQHRNAMRNLIGNRRNGEYLMAATGIVRENSERDSEFHARLRGKVDEQIQEMERSRDVLEALPKTERAAFMSSKPTLTGTFYRVVGGMQLGTEFVGGVVVEAFQIREPKTPPKVPSVIKPP